MVSLNATNLIFRKNSKTTFRRHPFFRCVEVAGFQRGLERVYRQDHAIGTGPVFRLFAVKMHCQTIGDMIDHGFLCLFRRAFGNGRKELFVRFRIRGDSAGAGCCKQPK